MRRYLPAIVVLMVTAILMGAFGVHWLSPLVAPSASAHRSRAQAAYKRGNYERSVLELTAALELTAPSDRRVRSAILLERAIVLHAAKQHDRAIADATASLTLLPRNADVLLLRAAARLEVGEFQEALADARDAANLDHANMAIQIQYLEVMLTLRMYQDVIERSTALLKAGNTDEWIRLCRARAYFHMECYQIAIRDFSALISRNPREASYYFNCGHCYYRLGAKAKATADLSMSRSLNQKYGAMHYTHSSQARRINPSGEEEPGTLQRDESEGWAEQ